jgi:uncharacterized damage-inducible protein DinB
MTLSHLTRFRNLLSYEREANRRTIESLSTVPASARERPEYDRAMQLLPHNLIARRVWLSRLKGAAYEMPSDWFPRWPLEQQRDEEETVHFLWHAYLDSLAEPDLLRDVHYTSSEGQKYVSTVDEILTHVFNHSTYHRGQIARLVTECGGRRATTDFIALTRRPVP